MPACEAIHVQVYQILDDILSSRGIPPGAKGAMFSAVDTLRDGRSNAQELARAEQISLEIHRLEVGLWGSDEPAVANARHALKSLAASWLNARIRGEGSLPMNLRGRHGD